MGARRKYKQLQFCLLTLKDQYHSVLITFRLKGQEVMGILNGNVEDWRFTSESSVFTKHIPGGTLSKYAEWIGSVPKVVGQLYPEIMEAAARAGYDLSEKEE